MILDFVNRVLSIVILLVLVLHVHVVFQWVFVQACVVFSEGKEYKVRREGNMVE